MILSCNSCDKKFVVPDNAITESGRLVQCSACGNKWKQFPVEIVQKKGVSSKTVVKKTVTKTVSTKKLASPKKPISPKRKVPKKKREINLYSPEYLAKKHGIKLKDSEPKISEGSISKDKVSFGFYSSLLVFLVFVIFFSRALFFAQSYIITLFPITEFYLSYFFESVRNIFEIWRNLITSY
tara:strand:+ start:10 stop:555 length:546 start_codon:yes stop_codon:yes gene_type:complete